MLVDIEIMVEAEEENNTDEKLEDLDIELEGVNQKWKKWYKERICIHSSKYKSDCHASGDGRWSLSSILF